MRPVATTTNKLDTPPIFIGGWSDAGINSRAGSKLERAPSPIASCAYPSERSLIHLPSTRITASSPLIGCHQASLPVTSGSFSATPIGNLDLIRAGINSLQLKTAVRFIVRFTIHNRTLKPIRRQDGLALYYSFSTLPSSSSRESWDFASCTLTWIMSYVSPSILANAILN